MPISQLYGVVVNKPIGVFGKAIDLRSQFYDASTFTFRDYTSVAEANAWLSAPGNAPLQADIRKGGFPVFVTVGGIRTAYWYKDGDEDIDLVPIQPAGDEPPLDVYNVKDHGLVGDGVTNDGPALQTLINTIHGLRRNAVIYFPDEGPYIISSALQDTSRSNCQIKFGSGAITEKQYTITLRGYSRPTFSPSAYEAIPLMAGTRIKSTLATGGGTNPTMFGGIGPVSGPNYECSYIVPGFENLIIQTVENPLISAIDLYNFTNSFFKDVSVIAGDSQSVLDSTSPTHTNSWGVRQPHHSSGINQRVEGSLHVLGFYNGMHVGEGAIINDLGIWSCRYALNFEHAPGQSFINRCIVGWCPYTIRVSPGIHTFAGGNHCMRISELDIERWVPGEGGSVSGWYDFIADLVDPDDDAQGEIVYRTVIANVGYEPATFTIQSGGNNVFIHEVSDSGTGSTLRAGPAFSIQPHSVANLFMGNNVYEDTGIPKFREDGYAAAIRFYNYGIYFYAADGLGDAGDTTTLNPLMALLDGVGPKFDTLAGIGTRVMLVDEDGQVSADGSSGMMKIGGLEILPITTTNTLFGSNIYEVAGVAHLRADGYGSAMRFYNFGVYFYGVTGAGTAGQTVTLNPLMALIDGIGPKFDTLAGSGTRMMLVDSTGQVSATVSPISLAADNTFTGKTNFSGYITNDAKVQIGALQFQSIVATSGIISQNLYNDATNWRHRNTGQGIAVQLYENRFLVKSAVSAAAGAIATMVDLMDLTPGQGPLFPTLAGTGNRNVYVSSTGVVTASNEIPAWGNNTLQTFTTVERDALTPTQGAMILHNNGSTTEFEIYIAGSWVVK